MSFTFLSHDIISCNELWLDPYCSVATKLRRIVLGHDLKLCWQGRGVVQHLGHAQAQVKKSNSRETCPNSELSFWPGFCSGRCFDASPETFASYPLAYTAPRVSPKQPEHGQVWPGVQHLNAAKATKVWCEGYRMKMSPFSSIHGTGQLQCFFSSQCAN